MVSKQSCKVEEIDDGVGAEMLVDDEVAVPHVPNAGWHSFAQNASVVPLLRIVSSQSSGLRLKIRGNLPPSELTATVRVRANVPIESTTRLVR